MPNSNFSLDFCLKKKLCGTCTGCGTGYLSGSPIIGVKCTCDCHEKDQEKAHKDFLKKHPNWEKNGRKFRAKAAKLIRDIEKAHRMTGKSTLVFGPSPEVRKKRPPKK